MSEKTRYTDAELEEFRVLILEKLDKARKDYDLLKGAITNSTGNDTEDTSPTFKILEEGAATLSKEEAGQLAQRQLKFIQHLQGALVHRKQDVRHLQRNGTTDSERTTSRRTTRHTEHRSKE